MWLLLALDLPSDYPSGHLSLSLSLSLPLSLGKACRDTNFRPCNTALLIAACIILRGEVLTAWGKR
jgi:hypothetical protein